MRLLRHSTFFILHSTLALAALCATTAPDRADQLREKLTSRDTPYVFVAAHRADWRYAPENSLQAIEHAISIGVDILEVDVQRTADGVLILMHDETVDRATSGKGKISDLTLAEIRALTLRTGAGTRTKHKVPTLEEVLLAIKGRVLINLDKADRYFDEVAALLKKTGTTRQAIMKGGKSDAEVRKLYGKYLGEIIYMPVIDLDKKTARQTIDAFLANTKPYAFEFLYKTDANPLPKQLAGDLKGKSLIWYNTLWEGMAGNHEDECAITKTPAAAYGYLIDTLGARLIQTDRAEILLAYLRQRGLHD